MAKKFYWSYNSHIGRWIKYYIKNLPKGGRRAMIVGHYDKQNGKRVYKRR